MSGELLTSTLNIKGYHIMYRGWRFKELTGVGPHQIIMTFLLGGVLLRVAFHHCAPGFICLLRTL